MEYVLKDTDIFDEEIDVKFNQAILKTKDILDREKVYKLTVSFHVNLLNDSRFDEFNVPVPSKTKKDTRKDKIYEVMKFQLDKIETVLEQCNIVVNALTIKGDKLEDEKIIKIEIIEDTSADKENNIKTAKIRTIVPSMLYTQEIISKHASQRISKFFYDIMKMIRNKKLMSEILEIEATEDDNELFRAFSKQYGELWFTTKEREKELLNRLQERTITAAKRYIDEENNGNG